MVKFPEVCVKIKRIGEKEGENLWGCAQLSL